MLSLSLVYFVGLRQVWRSFLGCSSGRDSDEDFWGLLSLDWRLNRKLQNGNEICTLFYILFFASTSIISHRLYNCFLLFNNFLVFCYCVLWMWCKLSVQEYNPLEVGFFSWEFSEKSIIIFQTGKRKVMQILNSLEYVVQILEQRCWIFCSLNECRMVMVYTLKFSISWNWWNSFF